MRYEQERQIEFAWNPEPQPEPEPVTPEVKVVEVKEPEPKQAVEEPRLILIGHVSDKETWTNDDFIQCKFKYWMAKIDGKHQMYKLSRQFLDRTSRANGVNNFDLSKVKNSVIEVNGVYRIFLYITVHGDIYKIPTNKNLVDKDYNLVLKYVEKTMR